MDADHDDSTVKPIKLNKDGTPRKQLSDESKEKLAKAREKANAIRQQSSLKKLEQKVKTIKEKGASLSPVNEENNEDKPLTDKPLTETTDEVTEPEPAEVKEVIEPAEVKKIKPKGKKKTKIIVEQSSDDSDEFEPNDHVVFVKRVSRKKKEPVPVPVPVPVSEPVRPEPVPVRPELTREQKILKSQYESMFSGGFINQNNLMRRHY